MQGPELVTLLAYLNYQDVTIDNLKNILHIELRTDNKEKQNETRQIRISFRKNKESITKFLKRLEEDSKKEQEFIKSIESINEFGSKLKILEGEEKKLTKIFHPNTNVRQIGKKNDFYLLWLILKELDTHLIETLREEILRDVEAIFKLTKHMPVGKDEEDFVQHIKKIIEYYKNY